MCDFKVLTDIPNFFTTSSLSNVLQYSVKTPNSVSVRFFKISGIFDLGLLELGYKE